MNTKEFKYYINVQREFAEDSYTMHESFDKEMSMGDIEIFLIENNKPYNPNYDRLSFHQIFKP